MPALSMYFYSAPTRHANKRTSAATPFWAMGASRFAVRPHSMFWRYWGLLDLGVCGGTVVAMPANLFAAPAYVADTVDVRGFAPRPGACHVWLVAVSAPTTSPDTGWVARLRDRIVGHLILAHESRASLSAPWGRLVEHHLLLEGDSPETLTALLQETALPDPGRPAIAAHPAPSVPGFHSPTILEAHRTVHRCFAEACPSEWYPACGFADLDELAAQLSTPDFSAEFPRSPTWRGRLADSLREASEVLQGPEATRRALLARLLVSTDLPLFHALCEVDELVGR